MSMPTLGTENTFVQKNAQNMKNRTKNILTKALTVLVTLIITATAASKLAFVPQLVEIYSRVGLLPYMRVLGIIELIFLAAFLWNQTRKMGLLLLTGYFGGAMAVELSHGTFFIAPAIILMFIWTTAYLYDESIFRSERKQVSKPSTSIL
jgi:hypothetical protein